jgi:NADH:ubiquinone oxidoreductase subunit E
MAIHSKFITATDNRDAVLRKCREALTPEIAAYIDECNAGPEPKSRLIGVLHKIQKHYGYLPADKLDAVAQLMQVPAAKVTGAATFYHYFRLQPRGRFVIHVCLGTACYVKGVERVTDKLKE